MKSTKEYIKLFSACPIEKGDTVRIVRGWKTGDYGYNGILIGPEDKVKSTQEFSVFRRDNSTYHLVGINDHLNVWHAPFFALELVKKADNDTATIADYLAFHKSSGLKVGDFVKVVRKAGCGEMGWRCEWVKSMDCSVGKTLPIDKDCGVEGWMIVVNGEAFVFPTFILQKVANKQPSLQDYQITICFDKKKKYFVASVPDIPSCMADGKDYVTALKNLDETFLVLQKTYAEEKMAFPSPTSSEKARTLCRLKR